MVFERILVGFDGSPASDRALALARGLKTPSGTLLALTVAETYYATHAGMDAVVWDKKIRGDAEQARRSAQRQIGGLAGSRAEMVSGYAGPALLHAAEEIDADLISVGSHGHSRIAGILLGSVATRVIHDWKSSVLVARGSAPVKPTPTSIVVGIDGSPASVEAVAVAEALGASTDACVRHVTATGGKRLPDDVVLRAELDTRSPVEALLDASRTSDLLVVGSRGLHGVGALGSVAERLAHVAECPVLIVRGIAARPGASPGQADAERINVPST
jgi:nucleotide-binding universal stress UspA family protein